MADWWENIHPSLEDICFKHSTIVLPEQCDHLISESEMPKECSFCGCDPYHYVDNGVGMEAVAIICCELGCATYDHRREDDVEITVTSKELREIASKIAGQRWQLERRDRLIGKLWIRRQGDRTEFPRAEPFQQCDHLVAEWQPIETAPKDGFFLVYEDGAMRTMHRDNGAWSSPAYVYRLDQYGDRLQALDCYIGDVIHEPTHWMELPDRPQSQGDRTQADLGKRELETK